MSQKFLLHSVYIHQVPATLKAFSQNPPLSLMVMKFVNLLHQNPSQLNLKNSEFDLVLLNGNWWNKIDSEPLLNDLCLMRMHINHHKSWWKHSGHALLFLLATFRGFLQALDVLARKFVVIWNENNQSIFNQTVRDFAMLQQWLEVTNLKAKCQLDGSGCLVFAPKLCLWSREWVARQSWPGLCAAELWLQRQGPSRTLQGSLSESPGSCMKKNDMIWGLKSKLSKNTSQLYFNVYFKKKKREGSLLWSIATHSRHQNSSYHLFVGATWSHRNVYGLNVAFFYNGRLSRESNLKALLHQSQSPGSNIAYISFFLYIIFLKEYLNLNKMKEIIANFGQQISDC